MYLTCQPTLADNDKELLTLCWGNCLLDLQLIDVSFSCVRSVIDHEFRPNIVKVAVDRITEAIAEWI